jgi:hypothetical protein
MTKRHDNDRFWLMRDFDTQSLHVFSAEHLAMHAAERLVGNRAVGIGNKVLLYGPGDGSTRIMIEPITRRDAINLDLPIPEE